MANIKETCTFLDIHYRFMNFNLYQSKQTDTVQQPQTLEELLLFKYATFEAEPLFIHIDIGSNSIAITPKHSNILIMNETIITIYNDKQLEELSTHVYKLLDKLIEEKRRIQDA